MLKWRLLWERLHSSLWFVPGLILLLAVLLALLLVQLDLALTPLPFYQRWGWLLGTGAEGARVLLSTVAGSMISVAGVAFSITIVALSLASNQYTSRVLRNFMRDRVNQTVLGLFVGIFAYCLVVLRTVRGDEALAAGGEVFVPLLAVFVGLLLAFVGVAVFIFFIHHISVSIQAVDMVAEITDETLDVIDRQYPRLLMPEDREHQFLPVPVIKDSRQAAPVAMAGCTGYLQSMDIEALVALAEQQRLQIYTLKRVGDFVLKDSVLAQAEAAQISDEQLQQLSSCFVIGRQRTVEQDMSYGIRQIVDVAVKALSPGINDTTTAVMCVHYLTAIASKLSGRVIQCEYYAGNSSTSARQPQVLSQDWRLLTCGPFYPDVLKECFAEIRQNAGGNVTILQALLTAMKTLLETLQQTPGSAGRHRTVEDLLSEMQQTIEQSGLIPLERARLQMQARTLLQQSRAG